MVFVSVTRLKSELRKYIEIAENGTEVIVTVRGIPRVKLVAIRGRK